MEPAPLKASNKETLKKASNVMVIHILWLRILVPTRYSSREILRIKQIQMIEINRSVKSKFDRVKMTHNSQQIFSAFPTLNSRLLYASQTRIIAARFAASNFND